MENQNNNQPECCKPKKQYNGNNPFAGILYGLLPHTGCILFIIAAILGSTVLLSLFKPLLMNRYIFHYLILISIGFATLSSFFYLRKQNCLSWKGIKNKKAYLSIMYGSTIGINLILFLLIFPMLANIGAVSAEEADDFSRLTISVNIPCPGHAPLITNELKTIKGVKGSEFKFPNDFNVYYDSSITNKNEILSLEVFNEYPATVISEDASQNYVQPQQQTSFQSCCGGEGCGSAETGVCGCGR